MFLLPTWLLFSILTGVASNGYNFLTRYILREKNDPLVFLWYASLAKACIALLIALSFDWHLIISPQSIAILFLTGITELAAGYCWIKMHEYTQLSISTIISRTRMIWIPIFAYFLLGEQLKTLDYISILILFVGVSVISAPHKLFVDKGTRYANAAALIIAINIIFAKMAIDYSSNSVLIFFHALPTVLLLPFFMKNARLRIHKDIKRHFTMKTVAVFFNVLTFYFFAVAIREGDASKVNAVYQGMLFLSVLAGIIFLKERDDIGRKLLGTLITIIGVVMLSLY